MLRKGREIFEKIAGIGKYEYVTQSRFLKLSRLPNMTNSNISKVQYDLLFKNVVKKYNNLMKLDTFFEALDILTQKLEFPHIFALINHIHHCL